MLPLLPGNTPNNKVGKERFHRAQHFAVHNNVPMFVGTEKRGIGGQLLPGQSRPVFKDSQYPWSVERDGPPRAVGWLAFDKQLLRFDGYYEEDIQGSSRVHRCRIFFYLEDDSVQVVEPPRKNAGVPQGTIIKRHKVPLPPPHTDAHYTVDYFNVGNQVEFYGKRFHLTDCDQFTRDFLRKLGVKVKRPESMPEDPYMETVRKVEESRMNPLRPYEHHDTLGQFLSHDGQVLLFSCVWEDGEEAGGRRLFRLNYFLADDTVQITEVLPTNAGRDRSGTFLTRGKLPKVVEALHLPGSKADRTILNTFGSLYTENRYILDNAKINSKSNSSEFYHDGDLMIGRVVNVWGRAFLIYDCDDFTKHFYRTKYGITDFQPISIGREMKVEVETVIPEHNGIGSEEDTLQNCKSLIPQPPKKDYTKFFLKDRQGIDSHVLRFESRLVQDSAIGGNPLRRFIVSYYLSDDTIQVYEPRQENSGLDGGTFFRRGKIKKVVSVGGGARYYTTLDMYIGAKIEIYSHVFLLVDADQYTYDYMKSHPEEFLQGSKEQILTEMRSIETTKAEELKQEMLRMDPNNTGLLSCSQFCEIIGDVLGSSAINLSLSPHQLVMLCRQYGAASADDGESTALSGLDLNTINELLQEKLKKNGFDRFTELILLLRHHDADSTGTLRDETILKVCKSLKVPGTDLIGMLLSKLDKTGGSGDELDYINVVRYMNWIENPAKPPRPDLLETKLHGREVRHDMKMLEDENMVNYRGFLQDLFGSSGPL